MAIPSSDGSVTFAYNDSVPPHGAEVRVIDVDNGGSADSHFSTFELKPGPSGYEVITQTVDLTSDGHTIVDVSVPSGKIVTGSGVVPKTMYDANTAAQQTIDWIITNRGMNTQEIEMVCSLVSMSGPHPTDSSKWRFTVMRNGWGMTANLWIAVVDAP